ncbi:MAG: hypothetical protein R3C59_10350 [Planctomycetaceae bacterium]
MTHAGHTWIALMFAVTISGCATGPLSCFHAPDPYSCLEPGSDEWWAERAQAPPGVRQRCHKGKMWPVRPRPTGEPQQFSHTYHSAHYWPLPYLCQDRQYIRDITEVQRANGWQQETTLFHRHFDENHMLSVPGQLHLTDILEITPDQYRTIHIQASYNAEIDSARVANVRNVVAQLTGGMEAVPVVIRQGRDYSRPASEVQTINDLYDSSIPTPRLGGGTGGGTAAATAIPTGP